MSWLSWILAISGWSAVLGLLLALGARSARREAKYCIQLRAVVEPYLVRHAQELFLEPRVTVRSSLARLDETIANLCDLTKRLAAQERDQRGLTDSQRMGVASTLPIEVPQLDS